MSSRRQAHLGTTLASGLLAGGSAVALRALVRHAAALRRLGPTGGEESGLVAWSTLDALDRALLPGALVGLAAGFLVHAARRRSGAAVALALLGGAALAALAAGLLDAPASRARLALDPGLGGVAALGALVTLGLLLIVRRPPDPRWAWPLLLLAVAIPAGTRLGFALSPPSFVRREARLDFLSRPDLWSVVEQHPDQRPAARVITPAIVQSQDAADKPALWMPPPCTVELSVPESIPPGYLRAAVGIDLSARQHLPAGVGDLTVIFELAIDGEVVCQERLYNERPRAGQWESADWTWRHLGQPGTGIPVEPGDRITLRTRLPDGHPAANMPAEHLVVGFGGLVVEEHIRTERTRARPAAPNLVLVVQDTLRRDHCSAFGYGRPTTPHLAALAGRGLRFDQAYSSSSWTWPSTASILTGLPADAHGVTSNESSTLSLDLTSVAEVLQQRGYTTAAFTCNPLIAPDRYFDQGFEHFEYDNKEFRKSDLVVPGALRWLEAHAEARFFLYLHLVDPHIPYLPQTADLQRIGAQWPPGFPEAFDTPTVVGAFVNELRAGSAEHRRQWTDLYDGSVAAGDRWLGEVLAKLEALGLTGNTVVVFTADHGEELVDRDDIGHGHTLHTELVGVPLVIAGPGVPAGVRQGGVVSNRHVAPTLAMLGGGSLPDVRDASLLLDLGPEPSSVVFTTTRAKHDDLKNQPLAGLRRGSLVVHWWKGPDDELLELFDVATDPDERTDIAAARPDEAAALRAELERRLAEQRAFAPIHQVGVGAAGRRALEGGGYGGDDDEQEHPEPPPADAGGDR